MRRKLHQIAVAIIVGALLLQGLGGSVSAQVASGPADEIYVSDNGDAVLVYESPQQQSGPQNAEFGVNVAENVVYGLITDPVEETPDVQGQFELGATRTQIQGDGNLSFPNPDAIQAFDLDLDAETTEQTSTGNLSLATTIQDESGMTGLVESVDTSGEVLMAADRLTATANLDVSSNVPLGEQQSLNASLAEDDDGYDLDVDWSQPVSEMAAEQWRNQSAAEERIRTQYQALAEQLGGSASVDISRVSVSEVETGYRLDQTYSVQFSGIDEGIESLVRAALAENPQFSGDQVDRLASGLADVKINEMSVDYSIDNQDLTGQVNVDIRDYNELALASFDIAQGMNPNANGTLDRARTQFEAQQAANLEQRFSWDGSLSHPESGVVSVELDAQSRATNWEAYVSELRDRDVPFIAQDFELTGGISDGRMEFDGYASMEGEGLFEELLQGLPAVEDLPRESGTILESIHESNPEKARINATYGENGLRIEAGASFDNLEAIRDALADEARFPNFTEIVSRSNETGGQTIVRVESAVSDQPTESEIRELPSVGDETTVHLPGEWDREFPSMDVERAQGFLSNVIPGSSGPGFGPIAGLVAIIAGIGLLVWRRS